ncbi:MAG TPA: hypothetical protein VLV45_12075 [Gemmatimonadales bacterium]|nr:hypothetical protein [Gemmatimonadales bacterium]
MRLALLLIGLAPFAIGACSNPTAATDCVYDKTAAAAPGNQLCTTSPVIHSEQTAVAQ